jgi:two-component system phosphate regulon response regulator PhoB
MEMSQERRDDRHPDRRRVSRGGRRPADRPGRHPTVLVADSYAPARMPYVGYLNRQGFEVQEAADGEQALALISANPPHVIVVDRALPRLSADRLTHWLAQSWRTRHIPVIVLEGGGVEEPDTSQGGPDPRPAAGALVKPFELAAMVDEIRRVLRSRGLP